jgi:hypothetical protein
MKTNFVKAGMILMLTVGMNIAVNAQDAVSTDSTSTTEESSPFFVNADFVSRYVWRGVDFGNSPAIQPGLGVSYKGLTLGAWGSYAVASFDGYLEADLYVSYELPFGLSLGITDYFFPVAPIGIEPTSLSLTTNRFDKFFDYGNTHFLEANLGYGIGNLSISANYMFYNGDSDVYVELGYTYKDFEVFVGTGNEVYSTTGNFEVVNAGVGVNKEIKFSDSFSLPVSGKLIVNPNTEQMHIVFGMSF